MGAIPDILKKHWRKAWTPPKEQTVQEWAEENLYLPSSASPKPGRYSTEMTPHVREPLKAYTDPETTYVILCWAAQSAKTTTELVCKCYNMANYDGNQIFLMPSIDMARSYSETRLQPIIESTPCLKKLKPRNRDKFKKLEMHMARGVLNLIGGSSATNLASRSAGRLFTDEIDKLKKELVNEADPLSLLFERAKWFPDKKIFLTSTPTTQEGHIWVWFLKGTQEYYYIPCADCGHMFTPKWHEHMKWSQEKGLSLEAKAKTAYLECPDCGFHMKDKHKYKMLNNGEWRAHNPEATKEMRSFHYNEIMSHITKWPELVLKFLRAVEKSRIGDFSELKNFVNSSLGEPWLEHAGQTATEDEVDGMVDKERPRGGVPDWINGLVCGVDTQINGFYYTIMGFGPANTSAVIAEGFVDNFDTLEKATIKPIWKTQDNRRFRISRMFIDAQCGGQKSEKEMNRTDEVYRFARKHMGMVVPCVGRDTRVTSDYQWSKVDKNVQAGGLQRCLWNTIMIKDLLFGKFKINADDPGSFHIHKDVDREFKIAMRSEFKNEKGVYEHIRTRPNHYLDCVALCFLGAYIQNMEYWDKPEEERRTQKQEQQPERIKPW